MAQATTTTTGIGPRHLSEEDIAHCLFLAQIDAGIYYPMNNGRWVLACDFFVARPSVYFVKDHPDSELYNYLARNTGRFVITYKLAPEFKGRRGYPDKRELEVGTHDQSEHGRHGRPGTEDH